MGDEGFPWHPRMKAAESLIEKQGQQLSRHERALFGYVDADANVWIDGLLQKLTDTSNFLKLFFKWGAIVGIPLVVLIVLALFLLVAHAYGWAGAGELIRGLEGK